MQVFNRRRLRHLSQPRSQLTHSVCQLTRPRYTAGGVSVTLSQTTRVVNFPLCEEMVVKVPTQLVWWGRLLSTLWT